MATGRARLLRNLALAVFVGSATVFAAAASRAAAAPPRWKLVDNHQSACFSASVHDAWYGVWIKGEWTKPINIGASGLPAGATFDTSYAPIPPGSSTGIYSLAYVHVMLATTPPIGTYTASLWATDGQTTKTVPITLNAKLSCY